jgi:cold shock CspA family protein
MQKATIVGASTDNCGYWFGEADETHESVFIHIKNVKGKRFLHLGDRVQFELVPNPLKPGEAHAANVEYIGHPIAKQTSGGAGRP